jgi:hypothetical protein
VAIRDEHQNRLKEKTMKRKNNVKTKSMHTKRRVAIICAAVTMFVLCSAVVCFAEASTAAAYPEASLRAVMQEKVSPNQPLDQEAISALIDELEARLGTTIEDEGAVTAISEKWEARDLDSKTRKEVLEILFADVRLVVKDKATQDKVWQSWQEQANETGLKTPTVKPEPPTPTPITKATPAPQQSNEDMIDLGEPPLATAEMTQVMEWISVRVAALRVPFCWRQSYGNTAGEPYTCRPGLERIGLLCYPTCKPGFHHSTANLCTTDCPAGFTDIGAFCQKPAPYGRGAGYGAYIQCLPPPPGGGARRFCAPDPNARAKNCEKDNGAGNCEEWGLLFYPKCKPGFHNVGANICTPDCPEGFADTGTGCTKPVYGVGAGEGLDLGKCRPGLEKDPAGALCYPTCKKDYHMVGPVCWQNCPAQQPADCGAGCATKGGDCASAVANMVIAPIVAAISLATFGSEGEIAGGVAHGAQLATTTAIEAERIATVAARLKQAYGVIKETLAAVKGNIAELVGGPENLQKIQNMAKAGGKIYTISSKITKELDMFSKEFADNFDVLTSKEIAAEIDSRFGKDAAYQIKRQWGLSHLTLMLNADGFATATNTIGIVAAADPTGLVGVVAAYMHPICENNTPFPTVHPLYNH